jgi:hypothetical protein
MPSHLDQGVAMKYKRPDFILIKGGFDPRHSGSVDPVHADSAATPSTPVPPTQLHTAAWAVGANSACASLPPDAPASTDPSILGTGLQGLREFDSLRLTGHAGVLQVGVNDLGWVVYDWFPGPGG